MQTVFDAIHFYVVIVIVKFTTVFEVHLCRADAEIHNLWCVMFYKVLDGLGLGAKGPPIPPGKTFAVVPFPVKRQSPLSIDTTHHNFFFVSQEDG